MLGDLKEYYLNLKGACLRAHKTLVKLQRPIYALNIPLCALMLTQETQTSPRLIWKRYKLQECPEAF